MPYEMIDEGEDNFSYSDIPKEIGRFGARQTSNIATRAVGLPGDIFSLINDFIAQPATEALTGEKGVPYEETFLGKALPTTEQHRKNIEPYFGDYLKPQNEVEKFADEVVEDFSLMFNPKTIVKHGLKIGQSLWNLTKSLGANLIGETTKQTTESEGASSAAKAGSLFLMSLLDKESAAKQIGKMYQESEKHLPSTATQNAKTLNKKIDALDHSITKGRPIENLSAPEKFVVAQTEKVRNLIKNGEISVEQAIAQKRSLHKELSTLYKEVPKLGDQKNVKRLANQVSGYLNEVIDEYGKKNPKFFKPYKEADKAFGVLANSNFISNWVENNVVQHPVTAGLMHLLAPVGVASANIVAPYQAYKLTYRISKDPTLAKIYANTMKAAAKENVPLFNKYLKQLDDALQKDEDEDRYEFVNENID